MPKQTGILILVFILWKSAAQQKEFRLEILQGVNKILIGENSAATRIGYSAGYGISFKFRKKNSAISFEPQIMIAANSYRYRVNNDYTLKITQRQLSFIPMAGIALGKNTILKTGFFVSAGDASTALIVYHNNSSYRATGQSLNGYYPNLLQAGVLVAISMALGEKKNWSLNIFLEQSGNSFLKRDLILEDTPFTKPFRSVFSSSAKPTVALMGLSYVLSKFDRKKNKNLPGD
jgi:hypothetical protein